METLSCHSNESTLAMTIKSIIYVEANAMNIYAKFQLHLPYHNMASEKIFEYFFQTFSLSVAMTKLAIWTKFIWLVKDYSRNISVKCFSKHLQ